MAQVMNATPRPWRVSQSREWNDDGENIEQLAIHSDDCIKVAKVETWIGEKERAESEANAELIVRAVNSYDALTDALRGYERLLEKVHRANSLQHAGGVIDEEDWSELYNLATESHHLIRQAKAALALAKGAS